MEIEYEARFLDEVVLRAVAARPEGRRFYRERERVYRIRDPEDRAEAFDVLNAAWCEHLDLARPLNETLAEAPLVLNQVARCAVGRPPRPEDAGAELLVRPPERGASPETGRLLRLLFAPELLVRPAALVPFLRRELFHVVDMLDPRFGYSPRLPAAAGGPGHERLLRDRYRAVWNTSVDGRLVRAGRLPPEVREVRRREFTGAFAALGPEAAHAFARFFDDPEPTHAAIVTFVTAPLAASRNGGPRACALCGLPSTDLEPDCAALSDAVRGEIERDFPGWRPGDGCCRQCADLYRARPLSLEDAAGLPGIR